MGEWVRTPSGQVVYRNDDGSYSDYAPMPEFRPHVPRREGQTWAESFAQNFGVGMENVFSIPARRAATSAENMMRTVDHAFNRRVEPSVAAGSIVQGGEVFYPGEGQAGLSREGGSPSPSPSAPIYGDRPAEGGRVFNYPWAAEGIPSYLNPAIFSANTDLINLLHDPRFQPREVSAPTVNFEYHRSTPNPAFERLAQFTRERDAAMAPRYQEMERLAREYDISGNNWANLFRIMGAWGAAETSAPGTGGAAAWDMRENIDDRRRRAAEMLFDLNRARWDDRGDIAQAEAGVSGETWRAREQTEGNRVDAANNSLEVNTRNRLAAAATNAQMANQRNLSLQQTYAQMATEYNQRRSGLVNMLVPAATRGRNDLNEVIQQLGLPVPPEGTFSSRPTYAEISGYVEGLGNQGVLQRWSPPTGE